MAFNGTLLKLGNTVFPLKYVYKESYEITPNRVQDISPNRNANGLLMRNPVEHTATTIQLTVKPLWNKDLSEMMAIIRNNYVNEKEKKLLIEYYSPDIDDYKTGFFYVPDIKYPINLITENKIFYNSFTLEFIEY